MANRVNTNHEICNRCVMDKSAVEITFDKHGNCNFCSEFIENYKSAKINSISSEFELEKLLSSIKSDGKGKEYDCVMGVSGGVDSSFALYNAKKLGLRPIAVHLDNGWNSELAVQNIQSLVETLQVDLQTHVINWAEFRDLQHSFIKAHVIDIELLTDNAMLALSYNTARKYGLKHILTGSNSSTEGMRMPNNWNRFKYDLRNIKSIQKHFGSFEITTLPTISTFGLIAHKIFRKIRWISFLDYFEYKKTNCIALLEDEIGFKPYPYKHYESVFTRFYQGYILPKKFGIDKRKLHLSNLIASGQLTRAEALSLLQESPYSSEESLIADRNFFLKKMRLTEEEFKDYLAHKSIPHDEYPNERSLFELALKLNALKNKFRP